MYQTINGGYMCDFYFYFLIISVVYIQSTLLSFRDIQKTRCAIAHHIVRTFVNGRCIESFGRALQCSRFGRHRLF